VPSVTPSSKKVFKLIIGLQMAKYTAFPAENPSIGNSSQLQLMKPFTMESATRWPGKTQQSKSKMPGNPGHFYFTVKSVFLYIFAYDQINYFDPD
jgi:hypothetical protein